MWQRLPVAGVGMFGQRVDHSNNRAQCAVLLFDLHLAWSFFNASRSNALLNSRFILSWRHLKAIAFTSSAFTNSISWSVDVSAQLYVIDRALEIFRKSNAEHFDARKIVFCRVRCGRARLKGNTICMFSLLKWSQSSRRFTTKLIPHSALMGLRPLCQKKTSSGLLLTSYLKSGISNSSL